MTVSFGPRRGIRVEVSREEDVALGARELEAFEAFDLVYRTLCSILYNYAPLSGHPGGSISSGRFVASLLFDSMDYDVGDPVRPDADLISYAAGHKALGLYAMWALRDEVVRRHAPDALPTDPRLRLRLEDLLGFRRNPITDTPLFRRHGAKPLDGHPTPATPFVFLATGASGVGMASSLGLALGAADAYGDDPPRVHVVEGEGGLTPGRVSEALAFAGTASLANAVVHVDWNQASIDSDRVTRDGDVPGEYVQWDPMELFYLHDWNVVYVEDGTDFRQVVAAQRRALELDNGQPTAVVYRTTKGWKYGIEGRKSHGGGHPLCSPAFYDTLAPLLDQTGGPVAVCDPENPRCKGGTLDQRVEECYWLALQLVRRALDDNPAMVDALGGRIVEARRRLAARSRRPRSGAPDVEAIFEVAESSAEGDGDGRYVVPDDLALASGSVVTLREQLGKVLGHYNRASGGALLVGAADLLGSTAVSKATDGFPAGYYNARTNPASRTISAGGICEDGMSGILSGLSSYGWHVGVGSSYGAFMAPLGHVAARLHAIGNQARREIRPGPYSPFILICGHAGLKTGEDGPTHADPQALQLLQENFPSGTAVTLTPWDPREVYPLITEALRVRPALLAPFVTRPGETVLDREALGLPPATAAVKGVYRLREASVERLGTVVLQGSGVSYAFVEDCLPLLEREGVDVDVYYVASAELFDALAPEEREEIFPEERAMEAMGITGFTLPTMYRWIRSESGRSMTLHPFRDGRYLGSGPGERVIAQAGLDGKSQFEAIVRYVEARGARVGTGGQLEPSAPAAAG